MVIKRSFFKEIGLNDQYKRFSTKNIFVSKKRKDLFKKVSLNSELLGLLFKAFLKQHSQFVLRNSFRKPNFHQALVAWVVCEWPLNLLTILSIFNVQKLYKKCKIEVINIYIY